MTNKKLKNIELKKGCKNNIEQKARITNPRQQGFVVQLKYCFSKVVQL
jgi:hypothetical protein